MDAHTGDEYGANQDPGWGTNPRLAIQLSNGNQYSAEITGVKWYITSITRTITTASMSPPLPNCVTRGQIVGIYLKALPGGIDGWKPASITTYIAGSSGSYEVLTSDPSFNKWVDYDEEYKYLYYDAKLVPLTLK